VTTTNVTSDKQIQNGTAVQPPSGGCSKCPDRKLGWFCSLGSSALADLELVSTPVSIPARAFPFRYGETPSSIYLICSGYAKLIARRETGSETVIRLAGPGSILGLYAVLSSCDYEVSACALTPLHLRSIKVEDFVLLLRKNKEIQRRALQSICQEYRSALQHSSRTSLSDNVEGRLGRLLVEMASQFERNSPEPRFPLLLTHAEIGSMLGATRETVTRTLSQFRKQGLIEFDGSVLVLKNPGRVIRYRS
jgi:CRP/FNR family transcriptional regulator